MPKYPICPAGFLLNPWVGFGFLPWVVALFRRSGMIKSAESPERDSARKKSDHHVGFSGAVSLYLNQFVFLNWSFGLFSFCIDSLIFSLVSDCK